MRRKVVAPIIITTIFMVVLIMAPALALANLNNPPVAVPNGPYAGVVGIPVNIDGSGSYDPDPGDFITQYAWDMDYDGQYDDAFGATVTWTWSTTGTKTIGLKVSDTYGAADFATTTVSITPSPPPVEVGGEVYPVNRLAILAPWIVLAAAIIAGATIAVRRGRARS